MCVYKYNGADEEPQRQEMKRKDFSPPDPKVYLCKDLEGCYRVYYEALKYSRFEARSIMGCTFYGTVWLLKMDESGNFIDFRLEAGAS